MRRWWSGLSQQTVNLSPSGFVGSNPTRRTTIPRKRNFACQINQTTLVTAEFEKYTHDSTL